VAASVAVVAGNQMEGVLPYIQKFQNVGVFGVGGFEFLM
jgi:hypothetical protein